VRIDLPVVHAERGPATVSAELDGPADGGVGRVVLMHGFARGPAALDVLTSALAGAGYAALRPAVPSFRRRSGMNDALLFDALADAIPSVLPGQAPIVMVGHSAGGAGCARMAARMVRSGVAVGGVLLVDANESLAPMLVDAVDELAGFLPPTGIRLVAAAPNRCNRQGLTPRLVAASGVGFIGVRQRGGAHCEIEGERTDLVCRRMCGAAPDPARTAALHALASAWIGDLARPAAPPGGEAVTWPSDVDREDFEPLPGSLDIA
jgi:hypothetical protein